MNQLKNANGQFSTLVGMIPCRGCGINHPREYYPICSGRRAKANGYRKFKCEECRKAQPPKWSASDVEISIDPLDASYMAGLIDGEGCIGIYAKQPCGSRQYPYHQLSVSIGMCDSEGVKFFREKTEHIGCYSRTVQKHYLTREKAEFTFTVTLVGKKAAELLVNILPYLKVKKKQAELAIEFYERCRFSQGNQGVTEEELSLRSCYEKELKRLKKVHE